MDVTRLAGCGRGASSTAIRTAIFHLFADQRLRASATIESISTPRFIGRMHHQRIGLGVERASSGRGRNNWKYSWLDGTNKPFMRSRQPQHHHNVGAIEALAHVAGDSTPIRSMRAAKAAWRATTRRRAPMVLSGGYWSAPPANA
jgi:hypothetical protein